MGNSNFSLPRSHSIVYGGRFSQKATVDVERETDVVVFFCFPVLFRTSGRAERRRLRRGAGPSGYRSALWLLLRSLVCVATCAAQTTANGECPPKKCPLSPRRSL